MTSKSRRSTLALELEDKGLRLSEVRRSSAFDLVSKGGEAITREQFEKLHDVIASEMDKEMEFAAMLAKKTAAAKRKLKLLICASFSLLTVLALSLLGNFFIIFFVVDAQVKTTTTGDNLLAKGSDKIVKTVIATEDLPLVVAPVLDLDTLAAVKSLKVSYNDGQNEHVQAELGIAGVRKHNSTYVEFMTTVAEETVETLNGQASLVIHPNKANGLAAVQKLPICSANTTCSAFRASGVDANSALDKAASELEKHGFLNAEDHSRRHLWSGWDGSQQCLDAPNTLVAIHSGNAFKSCAELKEADMCGHPSVKEGCCLTCTGVEAPLETPNHGRSMSSKYYCPPSPSWQTFDYTGSGSSNLVSARVRLWTGHIGTRNVVSILHGLNGDGDGMYNFIATTLDTTEYQGLLFVYPTSNTIEGWTSLRSWNTHYLTFGAYGYMGAGVSQLNNFRNYMIGNSHTWPSTSTPTRVNTQSKFLSIGVSDGGRCAIFQNLYNGVSNVHSAVGIAGHPMMDYDTQPGTGGIPADMDTSGIRSHAYWTSNDFYYESSAMNAYATAAFGSGFGTATSNSVGGYTFARQEKSSGSYTSSKHVIFEVHDGSSNGFGATGNFYGAPSHGAFCSDAALVDAILLAGIAKFTIDITPPAQVNTPWLTRIRDRRAGPAVNAPLTEMSRKNNLRGTKAVSTLAFKNKLSEKSNRKSMAMDGKVMREK